MKHVLILSALVSLVFTGTCAYAGTFLVESSAGTKLEATEIATFDSPWAMTFINEDKLLVTTRLGKMWLVSTDGSKALVSGVPKAEVGGQGGLGDVVPHPNFAQNSLVYFSMVESQDGGKTRGAVVMRATLDISTKPKLTKLQKIWTQQPKMGGRGHFSHRLAFGPQGTPQAGKIFITSGDRQVQHPAQDFNSTLGKIIRINDDGTVPVDNPFQDKGELAKTFWSLGHRNMLGIAFDGKGQLWSNEMGPKHGDELNLISPGYNYGWPVVSEGNHYSGEKIPNHDTRTDFTPPKTAWVPSIAPSGLVIYSGKMFPDWQGSTFMGGLVSRALIHVRLNKKSATEVERFKWQKRIREVEQGPKGALWVLEDREGARLLRFTP